MTSGDVAKGKSERIVAAECFMARSCSIPEAAANGRL